MSKVSVIVPVYKVEQYLDRCVESILNQTYSNLELILVDDGSPDNCPKMCDDWALKDNRIVVIHKENGGVSSARNIGLKNATGEYISFVDSDDWVDVDFLELLMRGIADNNALFSICGFRIVDNKNDTLGEETVDDKFNVFNNLKDVWIYEMGFNLGCCNKLYSAKILNDIWFNESLSCAEDLLFNHTVSQKDFVCAVSKKIKYNYYSNEKSVTHVMSNKSMYQEIFVYDYICKNEKNDIIQKRYEDIFIRCSIRNINVCITNDGMDEYFYDMVDLIKKHPASHSYLSHKAIFMIKHFLPIYIFFIKHKVKK